MLDRENIIGLMDYLRKIGFKFEESKFLYNPMEKFFEYVSAKEIVHSKILADLLDVRGAHGMGDKFIRTFLNSFLRINYSDLLYVSIEREKPVSRIVTEGAKRSIDLFIEYVYSKDNHDITKEEPEIKNAIIIENKLNNAEYQEKQLLDYYKAIEAEGYRKIDVICLHKYKDLNDEKIQITEELKPIIIYPQELSAWLYNSLSIFDFPKSYTLISYITLLDNLNSYNTMQENVNLLLTLDKIRFEEVKAIGLAYKELMENRLNVLREGWFDKEFQEVSTKPISRTHHIQIWNEEAYKRNKLFIVLWERAEGFTLYLASNEKIPEPNKYTQEANFKKIKDTDYGYEWFISNDISKQYFEYPQKEGIERMVAEIKRVLKILAK